MKLASHFAVMSFLTWSALTSMALAQPPIQSLKSNAPQYQHVKPILEKRCIVCHGCYDAPCQLKLSSYAGAARGASKIKVYDGERINAIEPTRLFMDAQTTQEWRQKGFYSMIGDNDAESGENSVLYRMLALKDENPQPTTGRLPESYTLGLNRKDVCPKPSEFDDFAINHPNWGMPYAMPNLPNQEFSQLLSWAKAGAPGQFEQMDSPDLSELAQAYETFLNQDSNKHQLMARYVFEHLILGHLHFSDTSHRTFYQLVRSRTAPGEPIDLIVSTRPFDDPGVKRVYYRLRPVTWSIVDKDHLVYSIDSKTVQNYQTWFIDPDYQIETLPGYKLVDASNPFKTYAKIPAKSRYRFMLDQAQFIIGSFIKGPVCRGQVALNVIEEQFWVLFFDPENDRVSSDTEFLASQEFNLSLPGEEGVKTFRMLSAMTTYQNKQRLYLDAKQRLIRKWEADNKGKSHKHDFSLIWDGNGDNPNAALTIFRNQDSATVVKGLHGKIPKTAWVIDYPLLERIQYLLVTGFDVYGNIGHQLNTRLYMDFLRMEGENNFLSFLPQEKRDELRDYWYRHTPEEMVRTSLEGGKTDIQYETENAKREFFEKWMALPSSRHLNKPDPINRPSQLLNLVEDTSDAEIDAIAEAKSISLLPQPGLNTGRLLQALADLRGQHVDEWPDVSFLKIDFDEGEGEDQYYTLFLNRGNYNVTSLLFDKYNRAPKENTITVMKGLQGAYPNMFFEVDDDDLNGFLALASRASDQKGLSKWVAAYGVRRTSPNFWRVSDDMHFYQQRHHPVTWGLFDLNRYRND